MNQCTGFSIWLLRRIGAVIERNSPTFCRKPYLIGPERQWLLNFDPENRRFFAHGVCRTFSEGEDHAGENGEARLYGRETEHHFFQEQGQKRYFWRTENFPQNSSKVLCLLREKTERKERGREYVPLYKDFFPCMREKDIFFVQERLVDWIFLKKGKERLCAIPLFIQASPSALFT